MHPLSEIFVRNHSDAIAHAIEIFIRNHSDAHTLAN
jgi:hypothetical protein